MLSKNYPHLYRFAWNNKEIPKGTYLHLIAVGKLNSAEIRLCKWNGERYVETETRHITDRRALRIVELFYFDREGKRKEVIEQ